ncbi:TPA: class IIb bacteriocin, lactobin A/cerein 7B family [Streptococcus suis]|nr:class IIb bacteriocin, lactobin A/cerein 7B family [Streptococcus suis]HEM4294551.1 class IIb bacteriocin, lactobin A/cerein 7B family [Streptococcus suis]
MDLIVYQEINAAELCGILGGGNLGAAVGGCLGGMLLAWAGGPVTGLGYAVVCGTAGLATYYYF